MVNLQIRRASGLYEILPRRHFHSLSLGAPMEVATRAMRTMFKLECDIHILSVLIKSQLGTSIKDLPPSIRTRFAAKSAMYDLAVTE